MKTRYLVVALLLLPASLLAQLVLQPMRTPLPDLVVADITLNKDCVPVVAIRNNGPAPVPDAAYVLPDGASVQMYKAGAPFGGLSLGLFDTAPYESQPAGGVATYAWFPGMALPNGNHVISVDVDYHKTVAENNELNNTLTKTLTCVKGPDLQPTSITLVPTGIMIGSPCRIVVTLRNNGPDSIPDTAYAASSSPSVQLWKDGAGFGGHSLITVDLSRELKPAGATKTIAWYTSHQLAPGVPAVLQLEVDGSNQLAESNETNNKLTQTVTCPAAPSTAQP